MRSTSSARLEVRGIEVRHARPRSEISRAAKPDVIRARIRTRIHAPRGAQALRRIVTPSAPDHLLVASGRALWIGGLISGETLRVPVGDPLRGVSGHVLDTVGTLASGVLSDGRQGVLIGPGRAVLVVSQIQGRRRITPRV